MAYSNTSGQSVGVLKKSNGASKIGNHTGSVADAIGYTTAIALGAIGDGVSADESYLNNGVNGLLLTPGVYLAKADVAISSDIFIMPGAIVKADTGVTVTIQGSLTAGDYKIFEGTGNFVVGTNCKTPEIKAAWFGVTLDDQTGTIPDDNMKAIRNAIDMAGSLGIPGGVNRSPMCRLPNGLVYVDDDDSDGVGATLRSYVTVLGYGDNSCIAVKDAAKAMDVFAVTENGANSWALDYCMIYGESSLQTNTQHGISVRPPSSPSIYSYIGEQVYIKEMNGNGIRVLNAGMDNSEIKPKICRDSVGHNLYVNACGNLLITGNYRSAKAGSYGAVLDGVGCITPRVIGAQFNGNNGGGLFVTNIGGRAEIQANRAESNGGTGFYIDRADDSIISGNYSEQNAGNGFILDGLNYCGISDNHARSNSLSGFSIGSTTDSEIIGNRAYFNGKLTDNTYDGFTFGSTCADNLIKGNMSRMGASGNRQRYGMNITDAFSTNNVVLDNDLRNSGVTGSFNDNGTGTDTTNGNKI